MTPRPPRLLVVVAVAVGVVLLSVSSARSHPAQASAALAEVRSRCLSAIERRLSDLAADRPRIADFAGFTSPHRAALTEANDAATAGLSHLAGAISSEDNFERLRAECRQIVEGFRVYALVLANMLSHDADAADADGMDTTTARRDLARMRDSIGAGRDQAAGVSDSIIGLGPSVYRAGADPLAPARSAARTAAASVRDALDVGRQIHRQLNRG